LQSNQVHGAGGAGPGRGRTENGLYRNVTGEIRLRKELMANEDLPGGGQPILGESGLLRQNGVSFNADLNIPPFPRAGSVSEPVVDDSGSARKCNAAAHNERLPVIAPVRTMKCVPMNRPKPRNRRPPGSRKPPCRAWLSRLHRGEDFGKSAGNFSVPEYVLFHGDGQAS